MKYEILEHPAELRIKIYGKTLEELFFNAVEAMANILASNIRRRAPRERREKIRIQSIDLNSLLVDFLNEILAKSQINKVVYQVSNIKISCQSPGTSCQLEAKVFNFSVDHFEKDIKAVTYQDLNIQKIKEFWQTILVFDI